MNHFSALPWFSAQAAAFAGSGIWLHEDGREVEVTLAHDDRAEGEPEYGWSDTVYLGIVTKRLRKGRAGWHEPPTVPVNLTPAALHSACDDTLPRP